MPSLPQGTGSSEVDKLFARLQPPPQPQPQVQNNIAVNNFNNAGPSPTTAEHWFAALTGHPNGQPITHTPSPAPTGTRGLALLDSIFASASNIPPPPSHYHLPPHPEEIMIVSPKPQSSQLPQILNQDVISTLLGLASDNSSRASSVAPSTTSSRRSGLNRYEGDNEFSDRDSTSEAGYSTTSTVADSDPAILAVGPSSSNVPTVLFNRISSDSDTDEYDAGSPRRVQGDVTPRVPARGIDPHSPPPMLKSNSQQFLVPTNGISRKDKGPARPDLPKPSSSTSTSGSTSTVKAANQRGNRLVPFEADSELWPYPRAPLDERTTEQDNDVVELDFSDTRALSDPAVFSNRLQKQKKRKDVKKKKTKEERAVEKQQERDAIEQSWDDPNNGHARAVDMLTSPGAPTFHPEPPAPVVNGNGKAYASTTSPGPSSPNGSLSSIVNGQSVQESLLSTLLGHHKAPKPDISRKHFMQEVLTLLYVRIFLCFRLVSLGLTVIFSRTMRSLTSCTRTTFPAPDDRVLVRHQSPSRHSTLTPPYIHSNSAEPLLYDNVMTAKITINHRPTPLFSLAINSFDTHSYLISVYTFSPLAVFSSSTCIYVYPRFRHRYSFLD